MENSMIQTPSGLLKTDSLCFRYHKKILIDHISFTLQPGEKLGIAGLRQSGRSLLLKLLAGAVRPSFGTVTLDGYTPKKGKNFYRKIGLVTEEPSLFMDLRAAENLDLLMSLKHCRKSSDIEGLLERLQLTSYLKERTASLSPGAYQRLALACALLHRPSLLLMDDVLYGLDAYSLDLIQKELKHFSSSGGTFLHMVHTPEDLANFSTTGWMEQGHLEILPLFDIESRWNPPFSNHCSGKAGE